MNYPKSFIARHIRFINDDVIEVQRYEPLHEYRKLFFLLSYVTLALTFMLSLFYEFSLKQAEVKWGFVIFITLFLIGKFIPNPRPVRFDKKRKIIYLWDKNRLWIKRYPDAALKTRSALLHTLPIIQDWHIVTTRINIYRHETTIHRLKLDLEELPFRREYFEGIQIGLFNNKEETRKLFEFIVDFLRSKQISEFESYKNLKNWNVIDNLYFLGFFTLKYNEEKTEKAIQEWLGKPKLKNKHKTKRFKTT